MGVKISDLTQAMAAQNEDVMPIVQNGETKKIEVQTLMSGVEDEISNLNTLITNLQTQLNNKNIITAGLSADVTKSGTGDYNTATLVKQNGVGTKLTISNGDIVIGAGISKVLISGTLVLLCASTSNRAVRNFSIRVNNSNVTTVADQNSTGSWLTLTISEMLIDVSEGDVIDFQSYAQNGDIFKGGNQYTHITVVAVN